MADEAVLLFETGPPIPMVVVDASAIEKGSALILADPMTVTVHAANDEALFAGILAEEKILSDGKVRVPVYRQGIFKLTGSAAISAGDPIALSGTAQRFKATDATTLGSKCAGIALEDCGGNGETFRAELRPGIGGSLGLS